MREGVHTLARRESVCLTERCRAPQNGDTPLHFASRKGHAAVVNQLLAAGADWEVKTKVRRAGDERCRWVWVERVLASVFSGCCWFPQQFTW